MAAAPAGGLRPGFLDEVRALASADAAWSGAQVYGTAAARSSAATRLTLPPPPKPRSARAHEAAALDGVASTNTSMPARRDLARRDAPVVASAHRSSLRAPQVRDDPVTRTRNVQSSPIPAAEADDADGADVLVTAARSRMAALGIDQPREPAGDGSVRRRCAARPLSARTRFSPRPADQRASVGDGGAAAAANPAAYAAALQHAHRAAVSSGPRDADLRMFTRLVASGSVDPPARADAAAPGLSAPALARLRPFELQRDASEPCCVCIEPIGPSDPHMRLAVTLGCAHTFHDGCIRSWLRLRAVCPLCKYEVSTATAAA